MRFIIPAVFIFTSALYSNTLYVQSPAAQLLSSPTASSSGSPLPKGAAVRKVGEKDMFIQVSYNGQDGWVNKLFLSTNPVSSKVSFGSEIDKSTSVKARARASAFTQTAAARGYSESKSLRTRGSAEEYDFASIDWLEKVRVEE
ncbi:MAG TPA: hypothetical protein PK453_08280 [Leptospiraceae bacterium]|nr:hypothetical protein [Leptospiraceae bacterium]HMY66899.1 hypothetical protein [Leptospiraceae bacterium]HNF13652.1 hypothetical protein [Leptospiraceae bacterium]HNF25839.1 hypothetical protein [Leptospiraceae bacterium]HNI25323.1 hypothetical protein [Leptospiraceae bacterium]